MAYNEYRKCKHCGGDGKYWTTTGRHGISCFHCGGTGKVLIKKTLIKSICTWISSLFVVK